MSFRRKLTPHVTLWLGAIPLAQVFARPNLPCSDSGLAYLLRAVQLHLNLLGGRPFLAWAPDLMHGYGYPLFGFYAPLSNWIIEALHLGGLDFGAGTRLAFVATLLVAAYGVRALIADDFGSAGGVAAGIAYMYAPYLLFDAIQRAGLPELMAFAFAPWALHFSRRAADRSDLRLGGAAVLALSAVVLSHNMVPILLAPFLLLGCAVLPTGTSGMISKRLWVRLATGLAIVVAAIAVTAFFWLPAFTELKWVQTWRGLAVHNQDYRNNLLPPDQLATLPPLPVDPAGLLNPPIVRTMGIVSLAASAGALASLIWQRRKKRLAIAFYALMLIVFFGLSTEYSRRLWGAVPGMIWFQLPTRFLGLASLGVAGLSGALAEQLVRLKILGGASVGVLAAGTMLNGLPWTYPQYCPTPLHASARDIAAHTRFPLLMTAEGSPEFLPAWVADIPDTAPFAAEYEAGRAPQRFDAAALPEGGEIRLVASRPAQETWAVDSPTAWTPIYRSFYFPGWRAALDGEPLPIRVTYPHGLLALDIPAGAHRLEIQFGATPVRTLTAIFSGLAALALVAFVARGGRRAPAGVQPRGIAPRERHPAGPAIPGSRRWRGIGDTTPAGRPPAYDQSRHPVGVDGILIAAAAVTLAKVMYFDSAPNDLHRRRLEGAQLFGVQHTAHVNFGDEMLNLGYDVSGEVVAAGEQFAITQYWTPLRDIGVPYGMSVRLADDSGRVWSVPDAPRPFGYADFPGTEAWPTGTYARDAYMLRVLPGTPPGRYWLEAGVFRRDIALALVPTDAQTGADPSQARLGQMTVSRGRSEPTPESALVEHWALAEVVPGLTLAGWTLSPARVEAGRSLHVELLWHATGSRGDHEGRPYAGEIALVDFAGEAAETTGFRLGGQGYPSTAWQSGGWVRDQIDWRMPARVRAGTYRLEVSVDGSAALDVGAIDVSAPERVYAPPADMRPLAKGFGAFAQLAGYSLAQGPTVQLTLVWQVQAETDLGYRVFTHVVDQAGQIVAQSDGAPAEWTRPTTGWLPGEYVIDRRTLDLPPDLQPGEYEIWVGLYDPVSGARVLTSDGADSAKVATLTVTR